MGVKRIVVSTVAVLLLLVGIVVVGMRLRGVERSSGGALRALPVDAAVVVRVRGGPRRLRRLASGSAGENLSLRNG